MKPDEHLLLYLFHYQIRGNCDGNILSMCKIIRGFCGIERRAAVHTMSMRVICVDGMHTVSNELWNQPLCFNVDKGPFQCCAQQSIVLY